MYANRTQNEPRCEAEMRYRKWKLNIGAQCFVIDVVSKMTPKEPRCEVKCILINQIVTKIFKFYKQLQK